MQTTEPTEELKRNVHDDEEIQWVVRPNATARFFSEAAGTVILLLFAVVVFVPFGLPIVVPAVLGALSVFGPLAALAVGGVAVALGVVVLLRVAGRPVARWLFGTTEYAATDTRLIRFGGVFGRSFSSVPLAGVQDAQYDIGTLESVFDVGTVTLDTDRGYEAMSFPYTPGPADFAREVASLAGGVQRERSTGEDYEPGADLADEEPADGLADNVYPDEQLLWVVTPDKRSRVLRALPGAVFSAAFLGAFVGAPVLAGAFFLTENVRTAATAGVGVGVAVAVLSVLSAVVSRVRGATQYAATDRRILEYEGRWGKRFDSIPLPGVQDAEYSVSATENLFGAGTVTLDTNRGYEGMALSNVPNPPAVAREVSRLAHSSIADREAVAPEDVSVGDGIDAESASADLERNLPDEESISWVISPDKRARLLANVFGAIPGTAVGSVVFGGFVGGIAAVALSPGVGVVVFGGVVVLLVGLTVLGAAGDFLFDETEYAMTDQRLVEYGGRFGRELSGIPLEGIQDAEYRVSFVEDSFGVGDVTIDTHVDYGGMRLDAVGNPDAVAREISEMANARRLADAAADRGAAAGPGAGDGRATTAATGGGTATDAAGGEGPGVAPPTPRKRCPDCGTAVDATSSFCPDCGAEQPAPDGPTGGDACRDCGRSVAPDDAFCRHCGASDPVTGTTRA